MHAGIWRAVLLARATIFTYTQHRGIQSHQVSRSTRSLARARVGARAYTPISKAYAQRSGLAVYGPASTVKFGGRVPTTRLPVIPAMRVCKCNHARAGHWYKKAGKHLTGATKRASTSPGKHNSGQALVNSQSYSYPPASHKFDGEFCRVISIHSPVFCLFALQFVRSRRAVSLAAATRPSNIIKSRVSVYVLCV